MDNAELVAEVRKRLGMSQMDMARYLDVSQSAISKWELGNRTVDEHVASTLREILERLENGESIESVYLRGVGAGDTRPSVVQDEQQFWAWHYMVSVANIPPQMKAALFVIGGVFLDRGSWVAVISASELGEYVGLDTADVHEMMRTVQDIGVCKQIGNVPYVFKLINIGRVDFKSE